MKKKLWLLIAITALLASCGSGKSSGGCGGKTCPLGGITQNETSLKGNK